jgi:hypothetical protein
MLAHRAVQCGGGAHVAVAVAQLPPLLSLGTSRPLLSSGRTCGAQLGVVKRGTRTRGPLNQDGWPTCCLLR